MAGSSSFNRASAFLRKYKKWPHSPFKTKWHENFNQRLAMEDLKQALSAESASPVHQRENSNKTHILSSLIHSFSIYKCDPTPQAYRFIIRTLAKTSQLHVIPSVLDHIEHSEKFETPEYILADIIRIYGSCGRVREAVDVFDRISNFRCAPSVYSLNALLSVLVRNKEGLKMVHEILLKAAQSMKIRLEESTFRILIHALCRIRKVGYAIELLNCMIVDGFSIDPKVCSLLLNSICKQKDLRSFDVVGFTEELRKTGYCPGVRDYTNIMRFLVDGGKGSDAFGVLNQMKCDGIKPDIVCYTVVLNVIIAEGDYMKADKLFDEILVLGLVPDVYTYNVYIGGFCKQNNVEGAIKMVSCMEQLGCKPNVVTYNILLKALVDAGELSRARTLWKEMELKGVKANSRTYEVMIQGLIDNDEVLEACYKLEEAFDKCFSVRSSRTDEVVCGLCQKGLVVKALELLVKMTDKDVYPGLRVWETLLHSCGSISNLKSINLIVPVS